MNLRQIRQFIAVAEAASLRKAAERLHMAQPPLTVAVRRMETELGGQLFERTRRGMTLTPLGQAILEDARQVVFHADQLGKSAASAAQGLTGSLSIGFVGSATYTLLPRALPRFRKQYPMVTLDLRERTTTQILRDVEAGNLDVGLVRYPIFEPSAAQVTPVEHDVLVVVVPRGHRLGRKSKLKLRDLAAEPFIMYSSLAALNLRGHVMLICQSAGFTPIVAQEAVQVQTIISLVESGLGIALVPSISQRHAPDSVVFVPLDAPARQLAVALAVVTRPQTATIPARHFTALLENLRDAPRETPSAGKTARQTAPAAAANPRVRPRPKAFRIR